VEPPLVVLVMAAACQDHLDQQAHPANPEDPANLVHPVYPETQENHQFNLASQSPHHHANLAHKDLPAQLDLPDHLEMLELLANLATLELTLHPANLDQKDHLDLLESLVHPEHPVSLVPQLKASLLFLENLDQPEKLDHPDLLDHLDNLVPMELLDLLDPKAHPAQTDHPDKTDNPVPLANPVKLDLPARKVSARNTVPSMVVCSSKTARDVKRYHGILFFYSCLQRFIQVSSAIAFAGRCCLSFFSSSPFQFLLAFLKLLPHAQLPHFTKHSLIENRKISKISLLTTTLFVYTKTRIHVNCLSIIDVCHYICTSLFFISLMVVAHWHLFYLKKLHTTDEKYR
jgi:hypothetical protein